MKTNLIANRNAAEPDIVLVGAGIMSTTLGTVLKELEPTLNHGSTSVGAPSVRSTAGEWEKPGERWMTGLATAASLFYADYHS